MAERAMILEYERPEVGRVRMPGNPIKMSDAPPTSTRPAPLLGEPTEEALGGLLGIPAETLARLRAQGAIA